MAFADRTKVRLAGVCLAWIITSIVLFVTFRLLLAPFTPAVSYSRATRSSYADAEGSDTPSLIVSLMNTGSTGVWYPGDSGRAMAYAWVGNPDKSDSAWRGTYSDPMPWTCLNPGEQIVIEIPLDPSHASYKIGVELRDWRGRVAESWSHNIPVSEIGP